MFGVEVDAVAVVVGLAPPEFWFVPAGETSSAVPGSPSEASEGIWTVSRGRAAGADLIEDIVFVREDGTVLSEHTVLERTRCVFERAVGAWWRGRGFASGESSSLISDRGGSGDRPKKCDAKTEPLASIGVKMLRDFEERCFG